MDPTYRAAAEQAAASAASAQGPNPSNPMPMPSPAASSSDPELHPAAPVTTESRPAAPSATEPAPQTQALISQPNPQVRTHRISIATNLPPSMEKLEMSESGSDNARRDSSHRGLLTGEYPLPPLPPLPQIRVPELASPRRTRTVDSHAIPGDNPYFNVPYVEKRPVKLTVGQRLEPTVVTARQEKAKYEMKAKFTGYALNIAIGLQVLLGSLTTGLSAVATTGRQTAVQTTILGGLATLVASYLARARGSNEPELSITRVKDLEHFIRDCEAFQMDYGHLLTNDQDARLVDLRRRFEELLGNASGERKLAPPV
ncbi:hypothetical protein BDQ17DRAFT_1358305 [Cyathus striatus]|nr:hypothetical protein BDQ17DRAFT_1358305 [Cyathus striatus]